MQFEIDKPYRGVLQRDTSRGDGVVAVDGRQFSFPLEGTWRSPEPPRIGMAVDVIFGVDGAPRAMTAVPERELAREQAEKAVTAAKQHGAAVASAVRSRFSVSVLIAEALLLIAFFGMPTLAFGFTPQALTGWDAIGLDPETFSTSAHGLLSILSLGLFGPVVVPFVRAWWARWLYVAPLAFTGTAVLAVFLQFQDAGRTAHQAAVDIGGAEIARSIGNPVAGMVHVVYGTYVVAALAIYLATRSRKAA